MCGIGFLRVFLPTLLYLMPSDIALHPGNVEGYNNEIQIAGLNAAIGHNPGINEAEPINSASKGDKAFKGKSAPPAGTVAFAVLRNKTNDDGTSASSSGTSAGRSSGTPAGVLEERQSHGQATAHEEEITVLLAIGIAVGLVVLKFSLVSPEQPRETGFPQQWPRPTNFLRAKSRSFPTCQGAKRQLSQ